MSELVAVKNDGNTHLGGQLNASNNSGKFFIGGLLVVYVNSTAQPDLLHPAPPTDSISGSNKVFSEGHQVHRNGDLRVCGAQTIVTGQGKVFAG